MQLRRCLFLTFIAFLLLLSPVIALAVEKIVVITNVGAYQEIDIIETNTVFEYDGTSLVISSAYVITVVSNTPWELQITPLALPNGLVPLVRTDPEVNFVEQLLIVGSGPGKSLIELDVWIPGSISQKLEPYSVEIEFLISQH